MPEGLPLQELPGFYTFVIFGRSSETFAERVRAIIGETLGPVPLDSVRVRESAKGRYLSVSVCAHVHSREQLEEIYTNLRAEPEVLLYI